jgi:hypothetical protein
VYNIAQQLWQYNRHWWVDIDRATGRDFDDLLERLLDGRKGIERGGLGRTCSADVPPRFRSSGTRVPIVG